MKLHATVIALAGLIASPGLTVAADDWNDRADSNVSYAWATVIESRPILETVRVSTPRQECWQERVVYRSAYDDDRYRGDRYRGDRHRGDEYRGGNGVGTVLGGVIGGAIGNAVGHEKRNKQVGTVVGAVVGATLGSAIASSGRRDHRGDIDTGHSSRGTEQVCRTYHDYAEEEHVTGYRVRYRYDNRTYSARMDDDPGDTIKIRLAVTPAH